MLIISDGYAHGIVGHLGGEEGRMMASSSQGGFALRYEESRSVVDISMTQDNSTWNRPSFSQALEARGGQAGPTRVEFSFIEPHCKRRSSNAGFARVSVSKSLGPWQEGAVGDFLRESNRRVNQVLR